MPPKKGQSFKRYHEDTKKEAVRLHVEEQWSYTMIRKNGKKMKPDSEDAARRMISEYIAYYNNERFQKKLGDLSPVVYREAIAA
ncbi:IS3 family transposase [Paenibacillus sp. Soil522]|uniref:IS3 family transposase n=1 Tax=Paenibacillus sp. Soil522 TaxID=1736388 RepID=UPI0006F70648|nr:IS3 family transposase [Paenibacillus sp. Soil522]KRE47382.1 hypothetical protein ASG81_08735 [Paenibacillus sp. Soil522]